MVASSRGTRRAVGLFTPAPVPGLTGFFIYQNGPWCFSRPAARARRGLTRSQREGPTKGESPTQYVQAGTCNTNIVPAGPLGDSADDVTVTPVNGFGAVPACSIPAFGPPPAGY